MTNRILIIGGAGFIGINAAKFYSEKKYAVTLYDNFSRKGSRENVKWLLESSRNNIKVLESDIRKDKKTLTDVVQKNDLILHLASQVAVTNSIIDPVYDFNVNLLGTLNILEAIRNSNNNPILLYASTNKVYGNLSNLKIIEDKNRYRLQRYPYGISEKYGLHFISPYGCSKGAADQYVLDYHHIYGLRTIVFRQSCIYGQHQFGIEDQGWIAWFIIAILTGKKITIYGDGKQVRDLLYIDDLNSAIDLAITNIEKTNGNSYNIGGGVNNTISIWSELKTKLENLFESEIDVNFSKERPGDQKIYISDIRLAKKDFKWEPKIGIDQGLLKLFTWAKQNKKMLETYIN